MAPIGTVDMLGWFSSPEVGMISLIAFLVLSITLVAMCVRCHRKPSNAYDVNGTTTAGMGGANGAVATKSGDGGDPGSLNWRDHRSMPQTPSTLERPHALTN